MRSKRTFWLDAVTSALEDKNVLWLQGVRRVGKTTLATTLANAELYDCELLSVRKKLEDPESFLAAHTGETIILDEIHRLPNPSEVLKIAADHFPKVKVLATGSSTLSARSKFRDTLTGRKRELWLVPMVYADLEAFSTVDLDRRMLRGGLPPFFLSERVDDYAFQEWIDSYWAKDLSELFVVDKKTAFMKFFELILTQSGDLFEAQAFTAPCEVSRQTIQNYLSILETTLVATVLRPYHANAANEIKAQPKVYGFDTGFVAYAKGWESLRDDDRGHLLEHLVLNELTAVLTRERVHFWRDKQKHEVDFVVQPTRAKRVVAIECKLSSTKFDDAALQAFRRLHPHGENWVVTLKDRDGFSRSVHGNTVEFMPFARFAERVRAWRS